jgi:hypothetical protein
MNANLNPIRLSRPNQFASAGAALLVSSILITSVIGLFASQPAAADPAQVVQQQAAGHRA